MSVDTDDDGACPLDLETTKSPVLTLKSYGIPHDVIVVAPDAQRDAPFPLEITSGVDGRYSLIVLGNGRMEALYPNGSYLSTLHPWQWDQIHLYQERYKIRLVALNDVPGYANATARPAGQSTGTAMDHQLIITDPTVADLAGINRSVVLSTKK
ncbi:hypothetical protein HDU67_001009 [Dinochytrium kinnereticum]|nr:hypothetical protein HDU67_001009 [Dinochytrium kinnereticum]